MIDTTLLTKRYYTISEVSEMMGVANSLLRYWEGEFKEIKPRKDRNGVRRFTVADIERLQEIYVLLKERGFTIEGAKKELSATPAKRLKRADVKQRMESILERLKAMRDQLG